MSVIMIMIMRAPSDGDTGTDVNNAPCFEASLCHGPAQPTLSHETSFILRKVCILIVYSTPYLERCHGNSKINFTANIS